MKQKVERAIRLIQAAAKIAHDNNSPLEIAYSGGKDSDVILELAKMSGVEFRAMYKNTTIDPPGTIAHAKSKGVEIFRPTTTFGKLIAAHGFPSRWARFCCSELKEYKIFDYAVLGIRRDESSKRAARYHEPELCRVYRGGKNHAIITRFWIGRHRTLRNSSKRTMYNVIRCITTKTARFIRNAVWVVCVAHWQVAGNVSRNSGNIQTWLNYTSVMVNNGWTGTRM